VLVAGIALLALAIRLLYIFVIAPAPVGLDGDWHFYSSAGNLITQGHFYYRGMFHRSFITAEHPPLYPLVLGIVGWFGGVGVGAQRAVGCVIGTASVVLFAVVGRRLGGRRAGLIAASIAAIYPPLIVVDGALMSEPLLVFGLLIAVLLAYRLTVSPTMLTAAALGAVVGLATLAHTEALLAFPLLVLPSVWRHRHQRAARTVIAVAVFAAVLSPWVVRNLVVFHRLTLATDTNTVIAGANCPQTYYGRDIGWWRLDCDARARTFRELVQGSANAQPALHFVREHLVRAPLVAAVRVLRTFSFFQPLREGNGQLRRLWLDVLGLCIYYPLLLLAALGLRRASGRRWLLFSLICISVIVSALDSGLPRLRIPADVSLILLAALAFTPRARFRSGDPLRIRALP
jgi:4-amino-4-deoxy-L-arabinose transferase-like glycosyltransferase